MVMKTNEISVFSGNSSMWPWVLHTGLMISLMKNYLHFLKPAAKKSLFLKLLHCAQLVTNVLYSAFFDDVARQSSDSALFSNHVREKKWQNSCLHHPYNICVDLEAFISTVENDVFHEADTKLS